MDTRVISEAGITVEVGILTNRAEVIRNRMIYVLRLRDPDVRAAFDTPIPQRDMMMFDLFYRFACLANVVKVIEGDLTLLSPFSSDDNIFACWQAFLDDGRIAFWKKLAEAVNALDMPIAPVEARPKNELTAEELADPNFVAPALDTA